MKNVTVNVDAKKIKRRKILTKFSIIVFLGLLLLLSILLLYLMIIHDVYILLLFS